MTLLDSVTSALLGTRRARRRHANALASKPGIVSGIAELARICGNDAAQDNERPIFLLSAGWRAGSTLLQRLIMSDPRVLLWGEPYDECGLIQSLAGTVKAFRAGWPPPDYYYSGSKPRSGDWVANLFPAATSLRAGHRALFEATFAEPARQIGMSRWGIKEVRLTAEHAHYLRWLWPQAKFVFLYRNPLHAYQSYCGHGRDWYDVWPERPVFTPGAFGRHWRDLCHGFLQAEKELGGLLVRYEELVTGSADLMQRIEQHLDVKLDRSILGSKVGSSARDGQPAKVSGLERKLLRRAVSPLAEELGYRW
jgi:hypothetical protein